MLTEKTTIKDMKRAIKDYLNVLPDNEISLGRFVKKIGYKYIHIYGYDFYGDFYETKMKIEDFFYSRSVNK